jgi:pyridoxal biosynthesis lyase PdxS
MSFSFAAGGVATPADAALMMQLGCDGGERSSKYFESALTVERQSLSDPVSVSPEQFTGTSAD